MPTASGPEGMNEAPGQPWIGKKESLAPHKRGASLKKKINEFLLSVPVAKPPSPTKGFGNA